jgi:hypothetical protein
MLLINQHAIGAQSKYSVTSILLYLHLIEKRKKHDDTIQVQNIQNVQNV